MRFWLEIQTVLLTELCIFYLCNNLSCARLPVIDRYLYSVTLPAQLWCYGTSIFQRCLCCYAACLPVKALPLCLKYSRTDTLLKGLKSTDSECTDLSSPDCLMSPLLFLFQVSRKNFEGFKKLFHRFLQEKGPSVDWAKINRPPEDSVSINQLHSSVVPTIPPTHLTSINLGSKHSLSPHQFLHTKALGKFRMWPWSVPWCGEEWVARWGQ